MHITFHTTALRQAMRGSAEFQDLQDLHAMGFERTDRTQLGTTTFVFNKHASECGEDISDIDYSHLALIALRLKTVLQINFLEG